MRRLLTYFDGENSTVCFFQSSISIQTHNLELLKYIVYYLDRVIAKAESTPLPTLKGGSSRSLS